MTLATEVTDRYGDQYMVNLTNPQGPGFTTVDTTRLGLAAADVTAEFLMITATTLDLTDALHVAVAVEGVVALLLHRTGNPGGAGEARWEAWRARLFQVAKVTGRDRVAPTTTDQADRVGAGQIFTRDRSRDARMRPPLDRDDNRSND